MTDLVDQVKREKTLIFTVTTGRSGTKYLTALLQGVPNVAAYHEPQPDFAAYMRNCQKQPETAFAFWLHMKLPFIAAVSSPVYAETSHLFCKGFLESALLLGLRPKLIMLSRSPSEVAWSLLERNTVPGRNHLGNMYLLSPEDPGVLPLKDWTSKTDYQLCFWYALEIERRQIKYMEFANRLNMTTFEVLMRDLGDPQVFKNMLSRFNLPVGEQVMAHHLSVSQAHHNKNSRPLKKFGDLEGQESDVWKAVMSYEPLLADIILEKHAPKALPSSASEERPAYAVNG